MCKSGKNTDRGKDNLPGHMEDAIKKIEKTARLLKRRRQADDLLEKNWDVGHPPRGQGPVGTSI